MKSKLTTLMNIMVIGLLTTVTVMNPVRAQSPTELLQVFEYSHAPGSSIITDCITAPVITCPSIYFGCPGDATTPDITGYATAIPGDENCEAPIVTYADTIISVGPCDGSIEIHRTWTAVYPEESNEYLYADCTQLISLADTDGPDIANCPENILMAPNENCEAIVTWTPPTATDECGLESLVSDYQPGDVFPHGVTVVTYTATDLCGSTSVCSFEVNVAGTCCFVAPVITCADDFLGCPADGTDPNVTGMATAIAGSEFCETPTVTYEDFVVSTGPCAGAKVLERTWTATYANDPDLVSTCIQNITLEDTKAPLITNAPTDMTAEPGDNCMANVTWSEPTATDNCSVPTLSSNYSSGDAFPEGETVVTYTAADDCGNLQTASFTVTVSTCCNTAPSITCPDDFEGCPNTDISISIENGCESTPTDYTGWAVATCNAEAGTDDPVGVIYDVRHTADAPQSADWAPSISDIHPANWTLGQIGQIFGIALGDNDDVYLAASDIYDTQYNSDPYGPGQIFKAEADNDFLAEPFVNLPNMGGAFNGIGNIVYDKVYHKLYASNLEDGKIYQISADGSVLATYDPWTADDGSVGVVDASEQVWGIGLNTENGVQKLYFPRIDGATRDMYSITLTDGQFPSVGSETIAFSNIMGVGERISDIAFSDDGSRMIFSERGTKFTTGAHDAKTLRYSLTNGSWQMDFKYYIGAWVTEVYPNIDVVTGENSAGGVDFGPTDVNSAIEGCDQTVWATMNWFRLDDGSLFYGMQGMDVEGNNASGADTDPNTETDIIIDFDGAYDNFEQKGDLGDVEIFKSGGSLLSQNTGLATATSGGVGCGEPLITYVDEVVSTGPCDGATVVERTWTATDTDNNDLSSSCTQTITLADDEDPVISNIPQDIVLEPSTSCNAVANWTAPTATDNCTLASFTSTHTSGTLFEEGETAVTYTATDACGNTSTASFTVTVTECCVTPPVITCPANFIDCPGTDIAPANTGIATAVAGSESCATPIVTYTDMVIATGPCAGAKEIVRTWTASDPDNSDLYSSCTQTITLVDNVAPVVFDCPADITITTTGTGAVATWVSPTATDNCELEWIMGDYMSGDTFPIGTTTVTYTAVDYCENVTPCTFTITVETEGTIECPDDIIVPCAGGNGTVVTWDPPTIETGCADCSSGDSIPGFVYMGSLNGSLYYCSTSPAASASATSIAQSNGGYLASITSQEENDLLAGFLNTQCALIGYSDAAVEGNFVWASGETSDYTNWAAWQPNNDNGNQDCAVLCTDGWYDSHCEIAYEFIMEIPCTTYEQTSGQPNGSVFMVGTDTITYVVTDGCGTSLTCSFTVTVEDNTTLHCPADHTFECPNGQNGVIAHWQTPALTSCCTDCNEADSIPGYMYMGSYEGSQYYCSMGNYSWPNANSFAQQHGGHLAEINNAGENAFLANILTLQRAWIGLNDAATEGNFVWSTGNNLGYTNWYPGQPNNQQGYQDYVSMLNDGHWNDEYNNLAMEYIMEVPCSSVTQIAGPPSGSVIPVGTTTITYAGMDGCGNTDTCSFDITILTPGTCQSYGQDAWYMWIDHIGLGDYDNASGNNDGYADFTDEECIEVEAGGSYPITLTPGFAGSLYTVYWKIWIDYNQDGDYLDAGEHVAYGTGYNTLTGILPITSQCLLGETTMRVSMKYGSYPSGPCAIFSHGEVEDYCINISGSGSKPAGFRATEMDAVLLSQTSTSGAERVRDDLDYNSAQDGERLSDAASAKLEVFPNPATDKLSLQLNAVGEVPFTLYDSAGKAVLSQMFHFGNGEQTMDVQNLEDGVYILSSEDGRYRQKVLIHR